MPQAERFDDTFTTVRTTVNHSHKRQSPITVKAILLTAFESIREMRLGYDVRTVGMGVIIVCVGCAWVLFDNPGYLATTSKLKALETQAPSAYWFSAFLLATFLNITGILFGTESCPGGRQNPLMATPAAVRFWLVFRLLSWFLTSFLFWLICRLLAHGGIGFGSVFTSAFAIASTINVKVTGQLLLFDVLSARHAKPPRLSSMPLLL